MSTLNCCCRGLSTNQHSAQSGVTRNSGAPSLTWRHGWRHGTAFSALLLPSGDLYIPVNQGHALDAHARWQRKKKKKSVNDTTSDDAPWVTTAALPTLAGSPAATSHTRESGAPSSSLQRGHITLRHSQFERELLNHPDKAWASWLLNAIHEGVPLVDTSPKGPTKPRISFPTRWCCVSRNRLRMWRGSYPWPI